MFRNIFNHFHKLFRMNLFITQFNLKNKKKVNVCQFQPANWHYLSMSTAYKAAMNELLFKLCAIMHIIEGYKVIKS